MRLFAAALGAVLALALAAPAVAAAQADRPAPASPAGVEGIWSGALDTGSGLTLRLAFTVTRGADGTLASTLDSIDQGAKGIPVDATSETNGRVRFELKRIGGVFEGAIDAARTRIDGTWSQGGASLPLVLTRVDAVPVLRRPQLPTGPFPYAEETVTFENTAQKVTLAGTITLPRGTGPFPAVLLVSGSGPQDRDETIVGHKPFLVLADFLTRRGIAVLRYDDRGTGKSTGSYALDQTAEDYGTDARAGVAYLKTRKDVDARRIGVVGHSEGALVAPILAANDASIAFVVLMAGPGTRGDQVLAAQSARISKAMGLADDLKAEQESAARMIAIVLEEKDNAVAERRMRAMWEAELAKQPEARRATMRARSSELDGNIKLMTSPYLRHFLAFDPAPWLAKVTCPVLALTGELDLQVPAGENLLGIATALESGGNRDYQIVKLPRLNHLFQTATLGTPAEYGEIEETFAPAALDVIGDWLERHAKPAP